MYYLILNGHPHPSEIKWEAYLEAFAGELRKAGAEARLQSLRDLDIRYCTGCWSCWWATPGRCSRRDDMAHQYPEMIRADIIVWASPLVMGNVSALTKKTQDRFVPLLHPYFELAEGEFHHRRRYDKNIDMGLIMALGENDTEEDASIVRRQHERLALNGRGRLVFSATTALDAAQAAALALEAAAPERKERAYETISA
jgi:multimeric flavodoxin WrbA